MCWLDRYRHAGTLISAICYYSDRNGVRQSTVRRSDDALCRLPARVFPLTSHGTSLARVTGSFPYQIRWEHAAIRSPLMWDVLQSRLTRPFGVFWYVGLIPDLATLRDRAKGTRVSEFFTACWQWDGAEVRVMHRSETAYCCSRVYRRPLCYRCTQ